MLNLRLPVVRSLCIVAAIMSLVGCGGEKLPGLGRVEGTVTMDGKPVPEAMVWFEPSNGKTAAAIGQTDAEGHYELFFSRGHKGANVGENLVKITTFREISDESGNQVRKETIPARYNVKTELKADVKRGTNKLDFELKSGGEIVQPGEEAPAKKGRSATGCG